MKKKFFSKLLTVVLAASMMLTLLPVSAMGWETYEDDVDTLSTDTIEGYQYNIFFLDCGRKYYTVSAIKQLIDNASAAGFNCIQLAVGNDGLRLLLDDMKITVGDKSYGSDTVREAIHKGNEAYYDFAVDELTQNEMDEIIAYAGTKGMAVIPCINTPGHMDAILDAVEALSGTTCSFNGSARTVDVTNETAVAYTKAIVQLYIEYFSAKGCEFFNLGADEYANDVYNSGRMGFGQLINSGKYSSYVNYVNDLAAMVKNADMIPMAFNDGIYFEENTSSGTFDSDIVVCYWSAGWGTKYNGYVPAAASFLSEKGHKLVNTHGDYYWVLGKSDSQCSAEKAAGFSATSFQGGAISNPVGSMFCIWADYPGSMTEEQVISDTADTIQAFGAACPAVEKLGGAGESGNENATITDSNGVTVTAPGLTSVSVTASEADTTGNVVSKTYSIKLNNGEYTGEAIVKIPYDPAFDACDRFYGMVGNDEFTVTQDDGYFVCQVPHFSDVIIYGTSTAAETDEETVTLTVGQTSNTFTVSDSEHVGTAGTNTTADSVASCEIKHVTTEGSTVIGSKTTSLNAGDKIVISSGSQYMTLNGTTIGSSDNSADAAVWTVAKSGNGYTLQCGDYYLGYAKNSGLFYLAVSTTPTDWNYNNNTFSVETDQYRSTYYIYYYYYYSSRLKGWSLTSSSSSSNANGSAYGVTTVGGTSSTTIAFTGVTPGNTSVTVGNVKYNIHVAAKSATKSETLTVGNSATLNALSVLDWTDNGYMVNYALTSGDNKISLSGSTVTGVAEGEAKVTATVSKNNVTCGTVTYTITVTQENLNNVTPLTIEYWITNAVVTANGSTSMTLRATDNNVYSENGAAMANIVPNDGTKDSGATAVEYWKSVRLAYNNKQTSASNVDKTQSGNDFAYIRYWNSKWSFSADRATWTDVVTGNNKDQLVAYYMQKTEVTNEVTTYVADYGHVKEKWDQLDYLNNSYVLLDYTVKYESGDETPSSFPTGKSLGFHCDGLEYRTLGSILAKETGDYEVYLITVTPSSDAQSTTLSGYYAKSNTSYTYQGTEKVAWAKTQQDFNNSKLGEYTGIGNAYTCQIGGEPCVAGLHIYKRHAMKVTFYVRGISKDQLTVHYMSGAINSANEFYSYGINVKGGTIFDANIGLANPWKGNLQNGSVTNDLNKTQTVSADLSTMPGIGAQYRYVDYTCTNVVRSSDGKEVYLYYTFSNSVSFVVDFGLPLVINPGDVNNSLANATIAETEVTNTAPRGAVTVSNNVVTYAPDYRFAGAESGDTFTITYTGTNVAGNSDSVSYVVNLIPASNVLYEENFFTAGNGWTHEGTTPTATQQSQKTGEGDYYVFGRDAAYDKATGAQGVYATGDNLTKSTMTGALKTSFYGNGFDLIGNCGANTGRVMLMIKGADGKLAYAAIVDTRYSKGDLYQVPLAHIQLDTEAAYTAEIYASGTDAVTVSGNTAVAAMSMGGYSYVDASNDAFAALLAEDGLTLADVEYIYMETANSGIAVMAADAAATGAIELAAGTHVEIDSFRVYRSTENDSYPDNEKNVTYWNILDVVKGEITAWTESGDEYTVDVTDYEAAGGPQNEIYLANNQGISFKLTDNSITKVQVSLRAVSGTAMWNGTEIKSNTEMYYTLERDEETGLFSIGNDGEALLAIGNVKLPSSVGEDDILSASEIDEAALTASFAAIFAVAAAPDEPVEKEPNFKPDLSVSKRVTNFFRSKIVTLTITTSTDVETLEINGHYLRPTNAWMVKMGWADTYTYVYVDTLSRGETGKYQITAYNIGGEPYAYYCEA